IVPGVEESHEFNTDDFIFSRISAFKKFILWENEDKNILIIIINEIFLILMLVIMYSVSISYRISLKSSSLVYLPLIWAARKDLTAHARPGVRLGDVLEDGVEQVARWYAYLILGALTLVPTGVLVYWHSVDLVPEYRWSWFLPSTQSGRLGYQI